MMAMKTILKPTLISSVFQILLILGYPIFLYFWPGDTVLFTLPIFIAFLISSLKKWDKKLGWRILSIILSFPLFWMISWTAFLRENPEYSSIFILLYALFYTYLLKGIQTELRSKKLFITLTGGFILFLGTITALERECGYIPEKGFTESQRAFCSAFNRVNPFDLEMLDSFYGFYAYLLVYPVVILGLVLLAGFLYDFFEKRAVNSSKIDFKMRHFGLFFGLILGFLSAIDPLSSLSGFTSLLSPIPTFFMPSWWLWQFDIRMPVILGVQVFGFFVVPILLSGGVWYLIGYYWKFLWSKKQWFIPIYLIIILLNFWLMKAIY